MHKTKGVPLVRQLYLRRSLSIVAFFLLLRVILSAFVGLGNDESYYWTYSQQLQWNYFDHPPLVAVWIRISTLNLWLQDHTFFLRAGSIAGSAIASLFMYRAVRILGGDKAAFTAVLLYNGSFYAGITAGMLITPDAPQMVFWTADMYAVVKLFQNERSWSPWIGFGIAAGLCIMSKVHGVFLWEGMFVFAVLKRREWFRTPQFYTAALITGLIISPIFLWNLQNDFITYRFHSERVSIDIHTVLRWVGLLRELIGELIINNPFIVIPAFWFVFSKKNAAPQNHSLYMFRLTGLSLLLVIFVIAVLRSTLPHWSGPAYICLIPAAAIGIARLSNRQFRRFCTAIIIYCVLFMSAVIFAINYYPGTFGSTKPENLGHGDICLDAYGWQEAGLQFAAIYNSKHGAQSSANRPPLVCNNWWGAHEEYFFARPAGIKMIGFGPVHELHQYAWRNALALQNTRMDTAYCIEHSDEPFDVKNYFGKYYAAVDSIAGIPVSRNGKLAHAFTVYELRGFRQPPAP